MPRRQGSSDCLTDEELAEMFGGEPDAELVAGLEEHIAVCASCREIVVGMARTQDDAAAPSEPPEPPKGERFGRYVLRDVIGVGAMGIVYAAHDPHLRRKIAIKVLKPGVAHADAQARARLLKEARAIARLAHPNVVTVYDVGLQTEHVFLAMEHIDGKTLRQWLAAARRSVAEVLAVCLQAARGLAAAHRAGVVHRDFKPANVLVGNDGRVCVTDFGLAHMSDATASQVSAEVGAAALALDVGQTVSGTLVGTPAYMAPEQLCGESATEQSDQFSFALTLFEALHRRRPFDGANVAELRENIVAGRLVEGRDDGAPAHVRRALRRGLSADPAQRFPSMDALIAALEPPRRRAVWIAAALVIAAGGVAVAGLRSAAPPGFDGGVERTRRITFDPGCEEYPSFLPDGRSIVFDALVDGDVELVRLDLRTGERRRLTHAPGWDFGAGVSPDGFRVVYQHFDENIRENRVLPVEGDAAAAPVSLGKLRGMPSWTRDGKVLGAGRPGEVLVVDPAAPSTPAALGSIPEGARALRFAGLRDGGAAVIWDRADEITLGELARGEAAVVREGRLSRDVLQLAASPTADGYYYTRPGPSGAILVWRPAGGGAATVVPGGISPSYGIAVSPDGRRLVWSTCKDTSSIARVGGAGGAAQPLSQGDWRDFRPRRLGDGKILLSSERSGRLQLWSYDLAAAQVHPLGAPGAHEGSASVDGSTLVYLDPDRGAGLWLASVSGGTPARLTGDASDDAPEFAYDGRRVVFERSEAGKPARPFVVSEGEAARPLTETAGERAAPSPVDDTVVYVEPDGRGSGRLMRTTLAGAPPLPVDGLGVADWRDPRISPDGKRLVVVRKRHELVEVPLDGGGPEVVRFTSKPEELVAVPEYAPDGDGFMVELFRYDGDLWLAEGRFR